MSSYLTSLYTTTTSRYASLRRNLLSSEEDGDTEDDSHISRVLRAYYTEKGRPFPPWLPPDPKAPQAQQAPAAIASRQGSVGRGSGSGSGLSDLWDSPGQGQAQEPMSLRRGAPARAGARQPQGRPGMLDPPEQQTSRPLPSQKAGSLQSQFSAQQRQSANPSPPPSSGSGTTAQERLKARLWGSARSGSPTGSSNTQGTGSAASSPGLSQVGSRNPLEQRGAGPPYPDDRGAGGGAAAGSRGGWFTGARSPVPPGGRY
ncbi:hypothetical protein H2201_004526 [Coniosporium apollinis]|uniref:Mso1 N-terminal domain-containing protein n=1 Tax=Coniosporium apollinis TaxID=61459 RepID=A0ABQ9NUR6_9PEZI|nr:hypothetical protein H2201_004526 [Coniosporium apollinis]